MILNFDFDRYIIYFFNAFLDSLVFWFITGGGVLAFIKAITYLWSLRIISFIRFYFNRNKFLHHQIFYKKAYKVEIDYLLNNINNVGRKILANDILRFEIIFTKFILKKSLKQILKKNLKEYIKSFPDFTIYNIILVFERNFFNSLDDLNERIKRFVLKNNYMDEEAYTNFSYIFTELKTIYDILNLELLNSYKEKKNIYAIIWSILDTYNIILELKLKTYAIQLNNLNGRLKNVKYKNHSLGE